MRDLRAGTSFGRFGGVYLLVLVTALFWFLEPQFRTTPNLRIILASQAVVGILTLGVIVALIAGVFDLSLAANMSFSISLVGWLQGPGDLGAVTAVVITLLTGGIIGAINAVIITMVRVDPIIATLGTSAILAAAAFALVDGQTLVEGISPGFAKLGSSTFLSIPLTVYYFFVLAVILWYVLEHTPWGRYLRATGANATATRLAGIKVRPLQWSALLVSGVLAALAGVVLTMQLAAASFGAGDPYLLPAFAAAFLGTTMIQPGRYNVVGTVAALYLLAVSVKGLQLAYPGTPWIANLISGLVLIVSVGLTARTQRRSAAGAH